MKEKINETKKALLCMVPMKIVRKHLGGDWCKLYAPNYFKMWVNRSEEELKKDFQAEFKEKDWQILKKENWGE